MRVTLKHYRRKLGYLPWPQFFFAPGELQKIIQLYLNPTLCRIPAVTLGNDSERGGIPEKASFDLPAILRL